MAYLDNPATTDLEMMEYNILKWGGNNTYTIKDGEDSATVQAAVTAMIASGKPGIIQLQQGDFDFHSEVLMDARMSGVWVRGMGDDTVVHHCGDFDGYCFKYYPPTFLGGNVPMHDVTYDDMQITFTTHSEAYRLKKGDYFSIIGTDDTGLQDMLVLIAAEDGDISTGIVPIEWPIEKTMTSVTSGVTTMARNSRANGYGNMRIVLDTETPTGPVTGALFMTSQNRSFIHDVSIDGFKYDNGTLTVATVTLWDCFYHTTERVHINGAGGTGLYYSTNLRSTISNCQVIGAAYQNSGSGIVMGTSFDNKVERTQIYNCKGDGISFKTSGRRDKFFNNTISGVKGYGIDTLLARQGNINSCTFTNINKGSGFQAAIYVRSASQLTNISKNDFENCMYGVYNEGAHNVEISVNTFSNMKNTPITTAANAESVTITQNTIKNSNGINKAIHVSQTNNSNICLNTIDSDSAYGILIEDADKNNVSINTIKGTTTAALHFTSNAGDNLATGNIAIGQNITNLGTNNDLYNNKVA